MKKCWIIYIVALFCVLVLVACKGQPAFNSTPSPEPTNIPLPTSTLTPQPTFTPTPIIKTTLALGERVKVDIGGYSLRIPIGFDSLIRSTQATISDKEDAILFSMATASRKDDSQTSKTVLVSLLASMKKDIEDLKAGEPYPYSVSGIDGWAVDVTGSMMAAKRTGRVVTVEIAPQNYFFAFIFVADGADGKMWESEGSQIFEAVIGSIEFFEPSNSICSISGDPGYGYTKENPIRVGGDAFGGPARERAYLDNLAGPKGEKISYERTGSMDFNDTILDAFEITGLGKTVTLYIDEYSYSEPQAPVGFTCLSAFPLSEP